MRSIVFLFSIVFSLSVFAGGSFVGNGGDWFIRKLPLLKVKLPDDFGVVEGVQYKKVGLRKCDAKDLNRLKVKGDIPDKINVIYLPDQNWNAYRVMLENSKYLVCSLGVADKNPKTSLQTLVINEDTDRVLYRTNGEVKYSKSYGSSEEKFGTLPIGSFFINIDPAGSYIGYNLQDGMNAIGYPRSIYFKPEPVPADFVYISLSIQERDRPYFVQTVVDNSAAPVWRIILPVAFEKSDLPIAKLASELRSNQNMQLMRMFSGIKNTYYRNETTTRMLAWSSVNKTPTSQSLRRQLMARYGFDEYSAFYSPESLLPHLKINFVPSILGGKLNHAAFIHLGNSGELTIPIVSQTWRIGADVVHELVHALQTPCNSGCDDDKIFDMEMEAHSLERQHLQEMIQMDPVTKYADDAFNYLVAASLPNVEWATTLRKPVKGNLCVDVISNYKLDIEKISSQTLAKYNCPPLSKKPATISRRR